MKWIVARSFRSPPADLSGIASKVYDQYSTWKKLQLQRKTTTNRNQIISLRCHYEEINWAHVESPNIFILLLNTHEEEMMQTVPSLEKQT